MYIYFQHSTLHVVLSVDLPDSRLLNSPKSEHICKDRNEALVWGSQAQSQTFPIGMNKSLDASSFLILVIVRLLLQEFIIVVDFFT